MNTSVAIHHLDPSSHESTIGHLHPLSITHFDHNKSEVMHHHIADNVQPAGLDTTSASFIKPFNHVAFWDSTDPHLIYIHPDGLFRPPRSLL